MDTKYYEGAIKKFEDLYDTIGDYLDMVMAGYFNRILLVTPPKLKIPEHLKRIVAPPPEIPGHSPITHLLELTGTISEKERGELLKLCKNEDYQKAINALHEQSLKKLEFVGLYEKAIALTFECQEIYRALKPELGLRYKIEDLVCPTPEYLLTPYNTPPPKSLITIIEIVERLKELRARERLLEGQKTPGAGDKPASLSIKTTLFYNPATGIFRFNGPKSRPVSKGPKARIRDTAKKLMKWWEKGKPCPMSEFVKDTTKKTPQWVYDETSEIGGILEEIKVNTPNATSAGYPPPGEPQNFHLES